MPKDDITPSRQQYLDIKRQHPNEILLFRLGDFYETFDEDAEITAFSPVHQGYQQLIGSAQFWRSPEISQPFLDDCEHLLEGFALDTR